MNATVPCRGQAPSGCISPLHGVTSANIDADGDADGGDRNIVDPGNGYRAEYARIRGR